MEIDIGIGKSGRQAYGLDDVAIVPSRRTRDPEDVDISWQLDAFKFDLPMMGSAMDSAISPEIAINIGQVGGLGVLNLEGLWSRYEDPTPYFDEIAELTDEKATLRMQEIYLEPVKPGLDRSAGGRDERSRHRHRRQPHSTESARVGWQRSQRRSRCSGHPRHRGICGNMSRAGTSHSTSRSTSPTVRYP